MNNSSEIEGLCALLSWTDQCSFVSKLVTMAVSREIDYPVEVAVTESMHDVICDIEYEI